MAHEMTESEINRHVRVYLMVFVTLAVLTVVTVAASYLNTSVVVGILIAILIACVKGSLVVSYFMHLVDEKKLIYWTLALTTFFFIGMLLLPLLGLWDQVMQVE